MTMDLSRLGRTLGITVGVAAGVAGLGAWAALRRPLPRSAGTASMAGLHGQVRIKRDRYGVPHIYAGSNTDLFRGLGYAHAQDRLWQMELNRRTGHGQLAEIFGPIALSSDRFIRTLGFGRLARREAELLDDETRAIAEAYVGGINGFLEANANRLPLEFSLLRISPRPWELADVLVWAKLMALNLCGNFTSELLNAQLLAAVGPERFIQLASSYEGGPITVPQGISYPADIGAGALRAAAEAAPFLSAGLAPGSTQGSNAWVVGPSRSDSGLPLLANDPHLALALPLVWYEVHLEGGDFAVAGATFPGLPAVVIGHNARIAWGVTNSMTDVQDLYIERIHPEDPLRYEYKGEWRELSVVKEEILVKGQAAPYIEEVRSSQHGPLIDTIGAAEGSPLRAAGQGTALALRWTALDPAPETLRAGLAIDRAQSWDEFRAALADWRAPAQNFVYADVDGHFGYALSGAHPIRAKGDGRLPVPGWDGSHEWEGMIPSAALPAALDPPEGFVATANNQIAGAGYRYAAQLRGEYLNPYRVSRIRELILASAGHSVASFGRIQSDVRSLPGLELARLMADLPLDDPFEQQARELLVAWDGELNAQSVGGTIYDSLRYYLERQAFAELGDLLDAPARMGAFADVPGNAHMSRAFPAILGRIAAASGPERADDWLGAGCTWNQLLHEAFTLAVDELSMQLGPDPASWSYGRVHSLTLRHPLGNIAALTPIFNRGPWPTGGDVDTVAMGYIPRESGAGPVYQAPSLRHIFEVGNWDASRFVLPSGQSGHPASPNYSDLNEAWRNGSYCPMYWSREAVDVATVATLVLEPK
jgi:penicillin amidase